MEYAKKIRSLTYGDFKRLKLTLLTYIEKTGDDTIKGIISAARAGEKEGETEGETKPQGGRVIAVFLDVFKKLAIHLDVELHAWFCELIDVTPEEYDELPVDMDVQILNQLKEAPEVGNFFTGVSLLSSGTPWLEKISKTLKSKLDTLTGSLTENLKD